MGPTTPFFVMGCPRSGTTLLALMLHAHSRIAVPPETRFLMKTYRQQRVLGDLSVAANRARLADMITDRSTRFHDLGLSADAIREAVIAGPPTVGSAAGIVFRSYAQRFGKPRWGDKRPHHYRSVIALRAMFPDAQFIHIVRDGRDCVASLKRVPWWTKDSIHAMALWTAAVDRGRRAGKRLGPGAYLELRYEDLVADPEREMRRVCDFLGETFEAAMLEPQRVAPQAVPERKTWHAKTASAISSDSVGSHAQVLESWETRLMHLVAGRRLRSLGYEVARTGAPSPWAVARYARSAARRRLWTLRRVRGERRIARRFAPVADQG
jgi:hypothetical protein